MADNEKAPDQDQELEPPKKSKLPLIIIIVVVLAGGGGGGAYFAFAGGKKKKEEPVSTNKVGPTLPYDNFIVNLADPGGGRYLKLAVDMELTKARSPEQKKLDVRLRDRFLVYLSSLRVKEVLQPSGKLKIKTRLRDIANEVFGLKLVKEVYIRTFVVQ